MSDQVNKSQYQSDGIHWLTPTQAKEETEKACVDHPGVAVPAKNHPTTWGIAQHETQYIRKTIEEIRNEDFACNKPVERNDETTAIQMGAMNVLNEIIEVNENHNFNDDFNFEETMLLYYKAMSALLKDDTETLATTMKRLENELQKMGEEREKEYQKIINRASREKWFNAISLGGTVAGGIFGVAVLASNPGTSPWLIAGAIAGTAILGLLGAEQLLGNPIKNAISDHLSKNTVKGGEAVLSIAGTLLYGISIMNQTALGIAGVTSSISGLNSAVTTVQNGYTRKDLESLKNLSELTSDEIEELGRYMEFISETLKKHIQSCRQIMKQPKIFN